MHLAQFGREHHRRDAREAARRHRRERRRRRHRRRLGGDLQGRVAQPPVVRRALPGRGDRRRRHRPRHHGDGRPPDRRDGPAAVRRARPPRHPAGAARASSPASVATATASACPTSAARSSSTTATRATRSSTPCASARCGIEDIHLAKASGVGNQVILFGAKTGGDGIGGVSVLASETFDDDGPTKRPAVQVGDPFAEKVLIECCLDLYAAHVVDGIQDLGGAGLSCATSELASNGDGGMRVELDRVPLRDASLRPEEILMSRVAGADDGGRRAGHGSRSSWRSPTGGTSRPPSSARSPTATAWSITGTARSSSTCRRARSPTTGPTYERPLRPAGVPGRAAGRRRRRRWPGPATGDELRATLLRAARLAQPLRQVVGHRPVRPLRPGQHRARPARRRRRGPGRRGDRPRRRRSRPTATAGSPSSTRTPARSSRWPRPTATSRPPAPRRWPSPTASTSARRRTPA